MDKERPSRVALAENFDKLAKEDGGIGAVAELLHIGRSSVVRIKGCGVVQTDTLEKISDHYGVEVHKLLMPNLGATMPFSDLTAHEAQLITLFRTIKDYQRQLSLISQAHKLATAGPGAANDSRPMGLYPGPERRRGEDRRRP